MESTAIYLRSLTSDDLPRLVEMEIRNKELFEQFSVTRQPDFYTLEGQKQRLQRQEENRLGGKEYNFGVFHKGEDKLIGSINLVQVMRGPVQSAIMGYTIDQAYNGRGYATEAVKLLVDYAFQELLLHRIEAGVMPHHGASIRVLEKAGFHKEGIRRKNVQINGEWQDHQMLAIINPED
ncbi:GNAT family N-acetyltransferase [Planococcus sp. FY231025]|uniref:GNAT family N-acetyltransferase n=1 Tax=Planococcus sp. FY231025 TaxID=3455699 RepID=UPI003F93094E